MQMNVIESPAVENTESGYSTQKMTKSMNVIELNDHECQPAAILLTQTAIRSCIHAGEKLVAASMTANGLLL